MKSFASKLAAAMTPASAKKKKKRKPLLLNVELENKESDSAEDSALLKLSREILQRQRKPQ